MDLELHNSIVEYNEAPVYLVLDPLDSKELPVTLYESEMRFVNGEATHAFAKATYTIETAEAERIAVDHAARIVSGSGGVSGGTAENRCTRLLKLQVVPAYRHQSKGVMRFLLTGSGLCLHFFVVGLRLPHSIQRI